MRFTVLGAGLIGSAIVQDLVLNTEASITVADLSPEALAKLEKTPRVTVTQADLQNAGRISSLVADADLVICALPGFMGFKTLEYVLSAGKNAVDISFFAEDAFLLDELAKEKGVTAIVDCGVAPGLCNILAGHVQTLLEKIHSYACYVGGLPQVRRWPYEYKAVFSPIDVLEEYTRPARLVEHGQLTVRPALSEVELVYLPEAGTLEAFNTDGLRTLLKTVDAPFMKEKTLRYPGHAELMRVFRESGFFAKAPISIRGQQVRPIDLTSRLLFDQWRMDSDDRDMTVMRVEIAGDLDGTRQTYVYDLIDRYDPATGTMSMARTTGYTCSIIAQQVASGQFSRRGISPPEFVGRLSKCYQDLLNGYTNRGIALTEKITHTG